MNRSRSDRRVIVGAFVIWLMAAGLAGAQGVSLPPRAPAQAGRTAPPAFYPGMSASPYNMGQVYPLAPPTTLPPVPPISGSAAPANSPTTTPSNPYWQGPAMLPYPAQYPTSPRNRYSPSTSRGPKNAEEKPHDNLFSSGAFDQHEAMLSGLFDLKMREVKIQKHDVVNVRRSMPEKEVSALIQEVNANRRLYANADKLTARLQERGLLQPGERVVGFAYGRVYAVMGSPR